MWLEVVVMGGVVGGGCDEVWLEVVVMGGVVGGGCDGRCGWRWL